MPKIGSKYKSLSPDERLFISQLLFIAFDGTTLRRGSIAEIGRLFSVDPTTISALWRRVRAAHFNPLSTSPGIRSKKYLAGRPPMYTDDDIAAAVKELPLSTRTSIRGLSVAMKISRQTVLRAKTRGVILAHTSAVKPSLTEDNMIHRIEHCLGHLGEDGFYKSMKHIIHIDEKWFYMTRINQRYYLSFDEDAPHRTVKHKGHIVKVMFVSAVAEPQYYDDLEDLGPSGRPRRKFFDGKIGIWPVGSIVPAARNSVNRPAGTPVWKDEKLDRKKYCKMLCDLVLPSIKEKFPYSAFEKVVLQQDNAPAHCLQNDPDVRDKIENLGLNVELFCQPPNSPDLNINDLAFFRSLQTEQLKTPSTTTMQLMTSVRNAYNSYDPMKLTYAFLTLKAVMNCIFEVDGGFNYKLPHLGKDSLQRQGQLPATIAVSDDAKKWLEIAQDDSENEDTSDEELD